MSDGSSAIAMPMLASMSKSKPAMSNGWRICVEQLVDAPQRVRLVRRFHEHRELVATEPGDQIGRRQAAAAGGARPRRGARRRARGPSVSFTSLKRSRSISNTAIDRSPASCSSSRSWKSVRFGRPVSGSWVASAIARSS